MTHETPKQVTATNEAPPFPHHAAAPQSPLEAAERQYAEHPAAVPRWQPEEGDFN